jgi:hypothetical protein
MTANYSDIAQYIADGNTPLQIVDLLQAETIRQNNFTQWSFGLIETQLDEATARTLAGVIQGAGASDPLMAGAFTAMSTTGIELHSDARQAMIEQIGTAAGMTAAQIAQVKALGVTYTAVDANATVESVQSLIDAEAKRAIQTATIASLQSIINPVQTKLNAIDGWLSLESNQALSVVAFQALADSLLGSVDGNPV